MTKPIEDLLPLPMSQSAVPFMNLYHDALHELVCFGTHILAWNLEQGQGREKERNEIDLAVPLLFRHILELLDAISVQIKEGIIMPCKVQLRAILEAYLSLEYLLQKDRKRRSACFLIVDHYRKLNYYKQLIPNTTDNQKLLENLKNHGFILSELAPIPEVVRSHKNQQALIDNPIYDEVRKEYLKLTKNNTKNTEIKWYALFEGPVSVVWLAKRLGKFDLYEFYYKVWSNQTHGTDLSTRVLVKGDDGLGSIVQLRNMEEAQEIADQTMTFALLIFFMMSEKVVSDHKLEFSKWFLWYKEAFRLPVEKAAKRRK